MDNECSIVKDLLPLYAEDLTSEDTAAFVKAHLEGCAACRAEYETIKEPPGAPAGETAAPLKAVKKKLLKKRLLIAACAVLGTALLLFGAFILFESRPMEVLLQQAESDLYTAAEIGDAMQAVVKDVENLEGCKLYSLAYAGDEKSKAELAYVNEFGSYNACIVLDSVFRSPLFGGDGGWNANEIYTWTWYLGRTESGAWKVVQKGYG